MTDTPNDTGQNGSNKAFSPPYGSFVTVNNLFDRMAEEGGVPARIDRSYLNNLPGSVQSTTIQSLKALDLVDDDLHPTPTLIEIVEKPDERKSLIAGLIREKYAPQLALGQRATTSQLEASLREGGIQGSTLRKAIAFFLAAARWAEVPISPHFRTPRVPSSERRSRRVEAAPVQPAQVGPTPPPARDVPPAMKHELIAGLIRELPAPGAPFPDDKQEAWFAIARASFRLIYKAEDSAPASGGVDED
jgi:hypothetical protein